MTLVNPSGTLSLLGHPYHSFASLPDGRKRLRPWAAKPGVALLWQLGTTIHDADLTLVAERPGGLALILILPPLHSLPLEHYLIQRLEAARPLVVLPYHERVSVEDITTLLRQPPDDLPTEVIEYLAWRGIRLDRETLRLVKKIIALSVDLRSVTALARSLYLSRRALGRRFRKHGLPVPSHWLHFARVLRVAIRLQNSDDSVLTAAYDFGYPDAFSLSNQMARLTGYRPIDARQFLGWEWLLEAWLRKEAAAGALSPWTVTAPLSEASVADARELTRDAASSDHHD